MGDSKVTSKKVGSQKRRSATKASKKAGAEKRKPVRKVSEKRRKGTKDEKSTHRVIDWTAVVAKEATRIARNKRAYEENPPSTREIRETILLHLTFMEMEERERAELEKDPEIRAELILLADQPADSDMRLPEIGDTRTGIEIRVHKKFPGLPTSAIWKSLDYLKKKHRVFRDDEESAKTRDAVYRVGPGPTKDAGLLSVPELVAHFDIPDSKANAFRKKLERWRKKHALSSEPNWVENDDLSRGKIRYLYRPAAIRHLI